MEAQIPEGVQPDFSGYVSKFGVKCTDGRTIAHGAFKSQDGRKVPLVYQHVHDDIQQLLGFTILSAREEGLWGDSYLNNSPAGLAAREAVQHKSVDSYSVWAKNLRENGLMVHDGDVKETSLVLAGANEGATIYNVLQHSDADVDDLMVIGGKIESELVHADSDDEKKDEDPDDEPDSDKSEGEDQADEPDSDDPDDDDNTADDSVDAIADLIDGVVKEALIEALTDDESSLTHSDISDSTKGIPTMRNVWQDGTNGAGTKQITHDDMKSILDFAKGPQGNGGQGAVESLRDFVRSSRAGEMVHADDYGVKNLEILFPDAQAKMASPTFVDRRQEWVKAFLNGAGKTPFSRVKTMHADITAEEARARGYIKGNQKVDEVFPVFKRSTGPAWVYKRQKLDRQDIIDITSFDVVSWMKAEMRGKLDEEIARAALFGDNRPTLVGGELNPDKIQDPGPDSTSGDGIRAILNDNDLYTTRIDVALPADPSGQEWNAYIDAVTINRESYLGSGNITSFMGYRLAAQLLTIRDDHGHRVYKNLGELATDMDVSQIVRVPSELMPVGVLSINVDLADYNFGTDRGGELSFFDDFNIDFNQYKYLYEVYMSGALTLPYSAQVYRHVAEATVFLEPTEPTRAGNVITIPTQTGVSYRRNDTGATVAAASTITLNDSTLQSVEIEAVPAPGYSFGSDDDRVDTWLFEYDEA